MPWLRLIGGLLLLAFVAGMIVLLASVLLAHAQTYGRNGMPPTGCAPGYLAVEPDATAVGTSQFLVTIRHADRVIVWQWDYVYADRECCHQVRSAVAEVVQRMKDPRVTVGECR